MAILSREELLTRLDSAFEDKTSDTYISLLEDVTDTVDSMSAGEDWRKKYEENDRSWREKYRARFFDTPSNNNSTPQGEEEIDDGEIEQVSTDYNDLWEDKK